MTDHPPGAGNQADYAAHKGVSRQTVTDWKVRGLVVFTEDGDVDFAATDRRLFDHGIRQPDADNLTDFPSTVDDLPQVDGLWSKGDAETVKENYAARLKQLEFERAAEAVVTVDDAARLVAGEYSTVRARAAMIGERIASQIVELQDPEQIKALIDEEVIAALEDLSRLEVAP